MGSFQNNEVSKNESGEWSSQIKQNQFKYAKGHEKEEGKGRSITPNHNPVETSPSALWSELDLLDQFFRPFREDDEREGPSFVVYS